MTRYYDIALRYDGQLHVIRASGNTRNAAVGRARWQLSVDLKITSTGGAP